MNGYDLIHPGYGKLLFVEDDPVTTAILKAVVGEKLGLNYLHAESGNDAIDMYQDNKNDISVVLVDIVLPDINGFQVLEEIRNIDSHVPVIAHTACALKKDVDRYKKAGFDDYILKPVKTDALKNIIALYTSGIHNHC